MKKALAGQSYMPCRSAVDNLTHPKEFHFATDDRLGPSTHHTQTEQKEKDFVGTLRQHPPSPVSGVLHGNCNVYVLLTQMLISADAYIPFSEPTRPLNRFLICIVHLVLACTHLYVSVLEWRVN